MWEYECGVATTKDFFSYVARLHTQSVEKAFHKKAQTGVVVRVTFKRCGKMM